MRDQLLDLVSHTHDLGCIDFIKITGSDTSTGISGLASDKSVVIDASFNAPVSDFNGTFGMPNLSNLKSLLSISEYDNDGQISVKRQNRKEEKDAPVGLYFQNATDDFNNDYRFMVSEVVNDALANVNFKGATWNVEFKPNNLNLQRLKMQAQAIPEVDFFTVSTDDGNLIFSVGDHSTHAGSFVFHMDISGTINNVWKYPIKQVISILSLTGDKKMYISDMGAMKITVNSGIASYNYILPAQSK
jgi:hypothetical protein